MDITRQLQLLFWQKLTLVLALWCYSVFSWANPLPGDQAFAITSATLANNQLSVSWQIAPGYHLYRRRINFSAPNLTLAKPDLPVGHIWHDPVLGDFQVFSGSVTATVAILKPADQETHIYLGYQGCTDAGFCYPPIAKDLLVQISPIGQHVVDISDAKLNQVAQSVSVAHNNQVSQLLQTDSLSLTLLILFGLGLLLAFTPCVLPMVPILSSIVLGQKKLTTLKAFLLSLIYVLAMALTYAVAGVVMGSLGGSVQASLQQPWVIMVFSALFIVLALAMFGLYELHLPSKLSQRIMQINDQQQGGRFIGVAVMGVLSALIVSPCVSAPLVGVLAYIAQTGNASFGGLALFFMALGMGLPLLVVGTLGGKFLPRSGLWMIRVKHICGFLLITVAVYLLSRLLPGNIGVVLYGLVSLSFAVYLFLINRIAKIIAALFAVYGVVAIVGGIIGHSNPIQPWQLTPRSQLTFIKVASVAEVQQQLSQAKGRPVLLDFYADWCVACKAMAINIFASPEVQAKLSHSLLLQADVTHNTANDQALEKYYGVYGPPTLLLFDRQGRELSHQRIVGEISKPRFLAKLELLS